MPEKNNNIEEKIRVVRRFFGGATTEDIKNAPLDKQEALLAVLKYFIAERNKASDGQNN